MCFKNRLSISLYSGEQVVEAICSIKESISEKKRIEKQSHFFDEVQSQDPSNDGSHILTNSQGPAATGNSAMALSSNPTNFDCRMNQPQL